MTSTFISPQTGSRYVKVNNDEFMFVGARYIGGNNFRITIRCAESESDLVALDLPKPPWSGVKDEDHISVVVDGVTELKLRVDEAIEAVRKMAGIGSMNTEWFEQVTEDHPHIVSMEFDEDEDDTTEAQFTCPHCGNEITAVLS